jgi:hypothetical protein
MERAAFTRNFRSYALKIRRGIPQLKPLFEGRSVDFRMQQQQLSLFQLQQR